MANLPKKVTRQWLEGHGACMNVRDPGVAWYMKQENCAPMALLHRLVEENHLEWANWLLVRLMRSDQCAEYAVFAARQVLDIFEKSRPDDPRPRKAIEVAEAYLKTKQARAAGDAAWAAWDAAWAAGAAARAAGDTARAAGDAAADAAGAAARAAGDAARAAGDAAADAAWAAARAAWAAARAAGDAAGDATLLRIIEQGIKMLEVDK